MELYVLDFTMRPPGEFQRLSARYPLLQWEVRPLSRRWLVTCTRPVGDPRAAPAPTSAVGSAVDAPGEKSTYLYVPSGVEQRFVESLGREGTSIVPPLRWCGGRLLVRVVSFGESAPLSWSVAFPEARLVRKRRTDPQKLFARTYRQVEASDTLTSRQSTTLLEAIRLGYYEMPRRSKVRDIARQLGIARSTAEEHLRAAESVMIRSCASFVAARAQLRSRTEYVSERQLFEELARFGTELDLLLQLALRDNKIDRLEAHPERHRRKPPKVGPGMAEAGPTWEADPLRPGTAFVKGECDGLIDSI